MGVCVEWNRDADALACVGDHSHGVCSPTRLSKRMKSTQLELQFLLALDTWSDGSLEALVLIFSGQAEDIIPQKYPDKRIQEFFSLLDRLRNSRKFEELDIIYAVIKRLCDSLT